MTPLDRFYSFLARPESEQDTATGALLFALNEYPDLDIELYLGRLDALGRSARQRLEGIRDPYQVVRVLNRLLFEDEGYAGDAGAYYDPRNSFLNEVMDRKRGIPITLSVLFIEVAARCRLPVRGVGFPGHFLVRYDHPQKPLILDPFSGGRLLAADDLHALLARHAGPDAKMSDDLLQPSTTPQILVRMLRNLKAIHAERRDPGRLHWVTDLLIALDSKSIDDVRDRGYALMELGRHPEALRDLLRYAELRPTAADAGRVAELIADLRRLAALMN